MPTKYPNRISYTYNYFLKRYGIIKTIRGIIYYCYNILKQKKLSSIKKFDINVNGYKMSVIPNDKGISAELLLFNTHEPLTTKLIIKEIKPDFVCLDIGSNIGYYACLESKLVGEKGHIIAIEPSIENFQYLKKNLSFSQNQNYETCNFACGDKNGETNFAISDRSNWSRIVENDDLQSLINDNIHIVKVPVKKIDTFFLEKPIEKLDFIRMDVEGYESKIYSGMKETIKKFKPILQIEVHHLFIGIDSTKKLLHELKNDGYKVKYYIPKDMDLPLMGNMSDIKKINIDKLIQMTENDALPYVFQIFLENH